MPSGSGGIVVDVRVFNRHGIEKDERSIIIERSEIESVQQDKLVEEEILQRSIKQSATSILSGLKNEKKIKNLDAGENLNEESIKGMSINDLDAIIPRIGSSVTFYGAAVIRQFETMDVFSAISSTALVRSRDKLRSLQILSRAGISMPKTVFTNYSKDINSVIDKVDGAPCVMKLLEGTQGMGVVLARGCNGQVSNYVGVASVFVAFPSGMGQSIWACSASEPAALLWLSLA